MIPFGKFFFSLLFALIFIAPSVSASLVSIERTDTDTFTVTLSTFTGANTADVVITRQPVGESPVQLYSHIHFLNTTFSYTDPSFASLQPGNYRYTARVISVSSGATDLGDNSDDVLVLVTQAATTSKLPDVHPLLAVVALLAALFVIRK